MRRSFRKSGEFYFWHHHEAHALSTCRSLMLAGHETTAKAVGSFFSDAFYSNLFINSPAVLWTLGVG